MKRFFTLLIVALMLVISCKNENLVEYIEKGLAKPTVKDVHFSVSNLGDENKIYVPSEQEIEVEFTIKNKYENEITGSLELDEEKKSLFNTEPYIKTLTPTKMVIAFNFKAECEPSSQNAFSGISVPIKMNIYEKKNSRFLSSQSITANCNTPPLSIPKENIEYKEDLDEYVVTLPKNEGKHHDLKEVKFSLSSKYGNESAKAKVVSVVEESEQNIKYTLKIKGDEEWQLKNPSGDRELKAVVYDRAGLRSREGTSVASRIFTSITLVPNYIDVSLRTIGANGVPVPRIKELQEFFHGNDWKKAGYVVSYQSPNFSYDEANDVFVKNGELHGAEYAVTVTLENGGNRLTSTYTINAVAGELAGIKQSELKITDESNYQDLLSPDGAPSLTLSGETIDFQNGADGKEGELVVPYTGFETALKVHVESISALGTIRDGSNVGDEKYKDFDVTLGKDSGDIETLIFYAFAEDGTTNKKYKIKFVRGTSVKIDVNLKHEALDVANGNISLSWDYGVKSLDSDVTLTSQPMDMRVAKNATVKFKVNAGKGATIKECSSTAHSLTIAGTEGSVDLVATGDFILNITLKPEASFKWVDIQGDNSKGYTKAKVSYYIIDNDASQTKEYTTGDTPEVAIQKGKECKFWIEGLNSEKYKVLYWKVNAEDIRESKSDGSIELNTDKTSLAIKNPDKNYSVKVVTTELYEFEFKVCDVDGVDITNHDYSFEVRKESSGGHLVQAKDNGKYVGFMSGTQVYITAKEGSRSEYDIGKWESAIANTTPLAFSSLSGEEIKERNFSITGNTVIRVTLKKKIYKVEWNVEGNGTTSTTSISANLADGSNITTTNPYVEIGKTVVFSATLGEGYSVKGWKVNDTSYPPSAIPSEITISADKLTLTISNIRKDTKVALMLEVTKYTIDIVIEAPIGVTTHNYIIKAFKDSSTELTNSISMPSSYRYTGIEHGTNLVFEAYFEGTGNAEYVVELWECDGVIVDNTSYVTGTRRKKLNWVAKDNVNLKVILKRVYRVSWNAPDGASLASSLENGEYIDSNEKEADFDAGGKLTLTATINNGGNVKGWVINGTPVTSSNPSKGIKLEDNNKKLIIENINETYTISFVIETYTVRVSILVPTGANKDNLCSLVAKKNDDSDAINTTPEGVNPIVYTYTDIEYDSKLTFEFNLLDSNYEVDEWKYIEGGVDYNVSNSPSSYVLSNDGNKLEYKNIKKSVHLSIALKKKTYKVEWSVRGGNASLPDGEKTKIKASVAGVTQISPYNVEIGESIVFEVDPLETGKAIKGWQVDGVYVTNNPSNGITISSDQKTFTLANIQSTHEIVLVLEVKKYAIDVYIEKPEATTHGYALKTTKNGSEITGVISSEGITTTGDTKYTYSDIEHGSQMVFEATTQGSVYEVDRWHYDEGGTWKDVSTSSQYTPNTPPNPDILKWNVNGAIKLRVLLRKKTYKVEWKIGGHGNNNTTSINVKADGVNVASSGSYVEIGKTIVFTATQVEGYSIHGWMVNGIPYPENTTPDGITISGDKSVLTISNLNGAINVILSLKRIEYTINVEIEKPAGVTEAHNYTIKATKGGTTEVPKQGMPPSYKYKVAHGTELHLEAKTADRTYEVKKWQYKLGNGSWTDFSGENHYVEKPRKIKYTIRSGMSFKAILKFSPIEFKIHKIDVDNAKLEIRETSDGEVKLEATDDNTSVFLDVTTKTKELYFKVLGVKFGIPSANARHAYRVASWKVNGESKHGDYNFIDKINNDSPYIYWKGGSEQPPFKVELKAGDKVELVVAKFLYMRGEIELQDSYTIQNDSNYEMTIKKDSEQTQSGELFFLPLTDKVKFNKNTPTVDKHVFVLPGTKLEMKITGNWEGVRRWSHGNVEIKATNGISFSSDKSVIKGYQIPDIPPSRDKTLVIEANI